MKTRKEEKKPWSTKVGFLDRITVKERIVLFKHLASMIDAGVPLEKGLIAIHKQTRSKAFHRILHALLKDLSSGEDLASSMKKMPHVFSDLVINLVGIGEQTGTLSEALFRIHEHFEKSRELKKKVMSALIYPMIVVAGTIGTVAYLVFVLLPQITPLFLSLNVDLPLSTIIVMSLAAFITDYWMWITMMLIVALILLYLLMKLKKFRYGVHYLLLFSPLINTLIKKIQVARFSQMIGVLLGSGISVVQAFKVAAESIEHPVYRASLEKIASSIQGGENIGLYLEAHPRLFSPLVTQMITVGEETGRLDKSFLSVSMFTEEEIDEIIKVLTTLLEPVLMLVIGGLVGFVAIAVITPIYQLTSGIGG